MDDTSTPLSGIFVYGTLKRGEINHSLLAPHVRSIEVAWLRGRLYDVGEFPALTDGAGHVYGELVQVDPDAVPTILRVLDRLEGCNPENDAASMYHRRVVTVTTDNGLTAAAYVYFYNSAHPDLPPVELLREVESGRWSGTESVGPVGAEELETYRRYVRQYAELSETS